MSLLFILFVAILAVTIFSALRDLWRNGLPRGSAPLDLGADGTPTEICHDSSHHHFSHDGSAHTSDSGDVRWFDGGHVGGGHH